jgi:hypothetical protein
MDIYKFNVIATGFEAAGDKVETYYKKQKSLEIIFPLSFF